MMSYNIFQDAMFVFFGKFERKYEQKTIEKKVKKNKKVNLILINYFYILF